MGRATPENCKPSARPKRSDATKTKNPDTKSRELSAFLFLTVILAPALSVALVGGYGLAIWMYQLIAGPPGAP